MSINIWTSDKFTTDHGETEVWRSTHYLLPIKMKYATIRIQYSKKPLQMLKMKRFQ